MSAQDLLEINGKMRKALPGKILVFGDGPADAKVVFVGQNPGEQEEKNEKPFVGRAGKFLNKTFEKNAIKREKVYITNIVKFKTPQNRKPTNEEIAQGAPFLEAELRAIKPRLVVLLGTVAWNTPRIEEIEYFETYHPSAAMQYLKARARFEDDFEKVGEKIRWL